MNEMTMTILAGHPYFKFAKPSVWQLRDGRWIVKWRDFHSMGQDEEFGTEREAMEFAARVCKPPLTVVDVGWGLADADQSWRDLARKVG